MDIFDLSAKLSLDTSEYKDGLSDVESSTNNFASKLGSGLATGAKVAGASVLAVGTAVAGAGTALYNGVSKLSEYGDAIDKNSQKMGVSTQFYQEWDAVLQHSGSSIDGAKTAFKRLDSALASNSDETKKAFSALGLGLEEVQSMSKEDAFTAIVTQLQGITDESEKSALATEIFGKGAKELGPLLNTSAEDTQKMIDTVNELGGVMSDEAVKNSAGFADSLLDLQTAFSGLANNALGEFLPSITQIMDGLTKLLSGDESGLGQISEGINGIITSITEALPSIMEAGGSIVKSIGQAIMDNLPSIMETGSQVILELATAIIENLPSIVETGLQIILQIANSISESLPELIPTIIDVILTIVDSLISNADLIVDGAIALILGLAEGLINAMPQLAERMPELVLKIVEAIIKNAPKIALASLQLVLALLDGLVKYWSTIITNMPKLVNQIVNKFKDFKENFKDIGKNIVGGLWEGIKDKWSDLVNDVSELADSLLKGFKEKFGIHSPSTVFAQFGEYCVEGFENGLEPLASGDIWNDAVGSMTTADIAPITVKTSTTNSANNSNTNVTVVLEGDAKRLFRVMQEESIRYEKITGLPSFA